MFEFFIVRGVSLLVQWGCESKNIYRRGAYCTEKVIWHTLCQADGTANLGRCIAICHAKNDLIEDRCRKCRIPLLK